MGYLSPVDKQYLGVPKSEWRLWITFLMRRHRTSDAVGLGTGWSKLQAPEAPYSWWVAHHVGQRARGTKVRLAGHGQSRNRGTRPAGSRVKFRQGVPMSVVMTGARGVPKSDAIGLPGAVGGSEGGSERGRCTIVGVANMVDFKSDIIDASQVSDPENDLCEPLFEVRDRGGGRTFTLR
jgi:hypothetical protein